MKRGRPRSCHCGECAKCKRADHMREWWNRQSAEKKRAYLDRRLRVRGEEIREADRQRYAQRTKKPEDPQKHWARVTVHNAIRDKRLFREPCEVCGQEDRIDAHHDDYTKPLDVRWLCRKHHMELHRKYTVEKAA